MAVWQKPLAVEHILADVELPKGVLASTCLPES